MLARLCSALPFRTATAATWTRCDLAWLYESAPVRVLFLCTGNSARSRTWRGAARPGSVGGRVEVFSAGSHPKPLHAGSPVSCANRGESACPDGARNTWTGFMGSTLRLCDQPFCDRGCTECRVPRPARLRPLEHRRPAAKAGTDGEPIRPASAAPGWRSDSFLLPANSTYLRVRRCTDSERPDRQRPLHG